MILMAPISFGELFDKWTILQIKLDRINDKQKLVQINKEFDALCDISDKVFENCQGHEVESKLNRLIDQLTEINNELWNIEDDIRELARDEIPQIFREYFYDERALDDDESKKVASFVELAEAVYTTNDERCEVKRNINTLLKSDIVEEKSYAKY